MKKIPLSKLRIGTTLPRVSDAALAAFLDDLSEVYRSKDTGNLALSNSLHLLAKAVRRKVIQQVNDNSDARDAKRLKQSQKERTERSAPLEAKLLAKLSLKEVDEFLMDPRRSKKELLDLAAARFSIPTSQLKRLRMEEVLESIKSALHHEYSIDILGIESRKDGASLTP